jgi:hypothetical protein
MRKIAIVTTILLFSLSIAAIVFAQEQSKSTCIWGWGEGCVIPPKPVTTIVPRPQQPEIQIARGVAVDRYYLTTEPVLFVVFRYNYWDAKMYLIVEGEFYKIEQIESRYDWNTNTRMFKYRTDDGNIMVLAAQEFSGGVSVSAIFKNYIITFEPIGYAVQHTEPVVRETQIIPLMPAFKQMAQSIGGKASISAETLISKAKPITEWTEKGK